MEFSRKPTPVRSSSRRFSSARSCRVEYARFCVVLTASGSGNQDSTTRQLTTSFFAWISMERGNSTSCSSASKVMKLYGSEGPRRLTESMPVARGLAPSGSIGTGSSSRPRELCNRTCSATGAVPQPTLGCDPPAVVLRPIQVDEDAVLSSAGTNVVCAGGIDEDAAGAVAGFWAGTRAGTCETPGAGASEVPLDCDAEAVSPSFRTF
mmetsp:Transcript_9904/g.24514  ORF Transcript_9904/g.24514 Transcript_9904/m.24514 type:complete len:208 (-) Transcript_9904:1972-2595(-)